MVNVHLENNYSMEAFPDSRDRLAVRSDSSAIKLKYG